MNRVIRVVRPVGHGLHDQPLRICRDRIVATVESFFFRREKPVIGENHLEFPHGDADQFDLHVAPWTDGGIFAGVFTVHLLPAHEATLSVDDLDFAMIAQSERPAITKRMGGAEPGEFATGGNERREVRTP